MRESEDPEKPYKYWLFSGSRGQAAGRRKEPRDDYRNF